MIYTLFLWIKSPKSKNGIKNPTKDESQELLEGVILQTMNLKNLNESKW